MKKPAGGGGTLKGGINWGRNSTREMNSADCFIEKILTTCKSKMEPQEIYLSEDDFKFSFANAAKACGANDVILEFPIKTKDLYEKSPITIDYFKNKKGDKFEESKSYIDISFEYEGVQYFIELKYKVASLEVKRYKRAFTLSEQGAGNIGLYAFHEDIERMEFIRDFYPNSRTFCILLTNNPYYWSKHRDKTAVDKVSLSNTTKIAEELKEFEIGKRKYRDLQCQNRYEAWHDNDVFKIIPGADSPNNVFKVLVIETKASNKNN